MPAGDAQRVWFPEMLDRLGQIDFEWDDWASVVEFCSEITKFRTGMRQAKGITDPILKCPKCGGRAVLFNGISIRSYLFALRKRELISEGELKRLDSDWSQYRKACGLDKFGQTNELNQVDKHNCSSNH